MHPQYGGRFVLERLADPDGVAPGAERAERADRAVRYTTSLFTPDRRFEGEAAVRLDDGEVSFSPFEPEAPPPWLVAATRAFLRAEWKARRAPDAEPWPDRITRWREEKAT